MVFETHYLVLGSSSLWDRSEGQDLHASFEKLVRSTMLLFFFGEAQNLQKGKAAQWATTEAHTTTFLF